MQVVFHTGSHGTDDDRLIKCLLSNKEPFSQRGVAVPGPAQYRALFKKVLTALDEAEPEPQAREVLIEAILDGEVADRVIFSDANFFGSHWSALGKGMFYPRAATRMANLQAIFAYDQVEMFMSIRNPASFVPDVLGALPEKGAAEVMEGMDLHKLHWTGMVESIRAAAPNVQLTLWCNEDTPLIWAQIIRDLAGLEHGNKIVGGFSLLSEIMSKEGMQRFRAYLAEHPELSEMQKRRVIAAFLDKYALEDAVEEELDLPGWTHELVDQLTELYDEDVFSLQRIPGVQFIAP
ncbi:hypothetical protein KBY24_14510 [Ruegeria pomeroyi]|uniref:Uncharacterized protein n=1 Tax=Ruegeria alba TaxID=2916756 RepID=A0ABS9NVS1_9RHOB|nr:hypothetical protein [Ruegeria alba]MCE8521984.1 hypothetical protein [Ruegeria pomeroyi]MCE8526200.1 hypothetical protein [Ruegeria pomeroyi]MCE8529471.1 hypothetical protein [Ruegeria pomeroyi]MCE8534603.1 hypothetical protein [Ruegeria pomeroyi]MCG6558320.1 hypothetical protein [Ruegeria alba]